jgi:hypothetical protein
MGVQKISPDLYTANLYRQWLTFKTLRFESSAIIYLMQVPMVPTAAKE